MQRLDVPVREPETDDELQALIEEARRRARRRRAGYTAAAALAAAVGIGIYFGFGGGGGPTNSAQRPHGAGNGAPAQVSQERSFSHPGPCPAGGGSLVGNVNGDGAPDQVSIGSRQVGRQCSYALMVQTREGRFVRPLGARTPLHGGETAAPRLDALVRLDRRPLSEIVADTASGASTSFADVFVFDHNRLVEMGGQAQPPGPNGRAFPYSGSVTHENAVDCVGGAQSGILVASGAGASGHQVTLTRQFFRVEGTEFNLIPGRTQEIRLRNERALGGLASRFPEFARGPFRSCSR